MYVLIFSLILFSNIDISENARILAILPTPSLSHNIVYHPILRELSLRGHQVTAIIADVINDPKLTNLTEINIHDEMYRLWNKGNKLTKVSVDEITPIEEAKMMSRDLTNICKAVLELKVVQNIIRDKKGQFDLFIAEWLLYQCIHSLAYNFKCPMIGIISMLTSVHAHESIGNHPNPLLNPSIFAPYMEELSFPERVYNTVFFLIHRTLFFKDVIPLHQEFVREHLGNNYPDIMQVINNVSAILTADNHVFYGTRPILPNIVDISGMHLKPIKPLPQNLQKILDDSPEGVIYFNMGTNIKSNSLPEQKRMELIEAFRKIPYKVIWKWENDTLSNKPSNVYIQKWFPQQDLLAHPNIKLFITQGGMQSTEEAIRANIPMVVIPIYADQQINAHNIKRLNIGIMLKLSDLSRDVIVKTIHEVINNKRYKENIIEVSQIMWDQPQKPLERAIWWIEFVLRHKGARLLKSRGVELQWYQIILLDVFAFLGVFIIFILLIFYILLKQILKYFQKTVKHKKE